MHPTIADAFRCFDALDEIDTLILHVRDRLLQLEYRRGYSVWAELDDE